MLPVIETFSKPAQGAAISWAGADGPAFVVPFPGQTLLGAFAAGSDAVLFVGSRFSTKGEGQWSTLFALFDRNRGCVVRRIEVEPFQAAFASTSRDGRTAFVQGSKGILVVDVASLQLVRRIELYRFTTEGGETASFDELDGRGPCDFVSDDDHERWGWAKTAGWRRVWTYSGFELGEAADGTLIRLQGEVDIVSEIGGMRLRSLQTLDWRHGTLRRKVFRNDTSPTPLDRIDPDAKLIHVTRRQVGLFRASDPVDAHRRGLFTCSDPAELAVVLHRWPLLDRNAAPITFAVRIAGPAEAKQDLVPRFHEDPRDGLLWFSFLDGHIRSLDEAGTLGPLIALGGEPNVPSDAHDRCRLYPEVSFQGEDLVVAHVHGRSWPLKMARYALRAADLVGRTEPVTLMPAKPGPLPGSHVKGFAAFVRAHRRDRFALPEWSRDNVAAALEAQRAAVAAGLPHLVDPEEDRLTFHYRVAGKPVKEAAFFRRIARDALAVVPELRALLLAYTDQLGAGGEGAQPWQDPDEGVGGLGPALHALALLDPDCLDVLRAYLETRDGEHEGYCLDVVVPAYLDRHGWRDAATVRFGMYATLNRFWGGSTPADGFGGMSEAMAEFMTSADVAATVLQEAEHFGRKAEYGYDTAAYRAAFRTLLDPGRPFEAAVLDALPEAPPAA